jgi:hypothetical protein
LNNQQRFRPQAQAAEPYVQSGTEPSGRDPRQVDIGLAQIGAYHIEPDECPQDPVEGYVRVQFSADEARVSDRVAAYRKAVILICFTVAIVVHWSKKNEILYPVIENVAGKTNPLRLVPKRKIDPVRPLSPEILVADLEAKVADVRAVVIELFKRRSAVRMRKVSDE